MSLTIRILTRQVIDSTTFSGLLSTVNDSTPVAGQLGGSWYVTDGTSSLGYRYVKMASSIGSLVANAPVYFTDLARRTVNSTLSAAYSYVAASDSAIESAAGLLLNSSATAAYGVWIQISGPLASIPSPGSVVPGDRLVLSNAATTVPTINAFTRVGYGTAPATPEALAVLYIMALASVASSLTTGWIMGSCGIP